MNYNEYEYDYHDLADEAYYFEDDNDQDKDEPWMVYDKNDNEIVDSTEWDNYYHNIADEIADD